MNVQPKKMLLKTQQKESPKKSAPAKSKEIALLPSESVSLTGNSSVSPTLGESASSPDKRETPIKIEKTAQQNSALPKNLTILGPGGQPLPLAVNADGTLQIKDLDLLSSLTKLAVQKNLEDPGFVNPLSHVDPKKMSPLGDILEIESSETKDVLASRQPEIRNWAVQQKIFNQEFEALTVVKNAEGKVVYDESGRAKQRDIPVEVLRAYESRWTQETPSDKEIATLQKWMPEGSKLSALSPEQKKLDAGQMTRILTSYRDRGHFEDVSRFYEAMRSKAPHLGHYEIPREHYIVSLNKQKRIKESIRESEALINERVEEVNHGPMGFIEASRRNLYRSLGINGEVLSGLGKAYKVIHQKAEAQIDDKVANADLASLVSQLTGVSKDDWTLGQETVGSVADKKASARFTERFETLASRQDKPLETAADIVAWVETATGTESKNWKKPAGESLVGELKATWAEAGSQELLGAVESLTGRTLQNWAFRDEAVEETAAQPINATLGKLVRGRAKLDDLKSQLGSITGKALKGALAEAAIKGRINEVMESVTKRGTLDAELVGRVENNAAAPIGKNLLKASRKSLEVSRDYYLAGFGVDVEYYPGINVIYNELALGNHKSAEGLIPIVQYAVMREGGATSKDYWNLATQAELAAIGNQAKTVHDLLPRLLSSAKASWELGSTAGNLASLAEKRVEDGQQSELIEFVADTFQKRMDIGFPAPADFDLDTFVKEAQAELASTHEISAVAQDLSPEELVRKEITDRIQAKSKNFQEVFTSKFVGGSWKFVSRGGVSDRPINRQTIRALREVNKHLGLNELNGPEDFPIFHSRALNYIDNKFALVDEETGERVMEDLKSEEHHKRDRFTQSRHDVFHSRTSGSAQTNLAVEISLGQSDCRDTDATYQVMFDLWKRDQQTHLLQGAIDAVLDGHESALENNMERAKEWDKTQVVSMDLGFYAPVKLNLDDDGNPQKYDIAKDSKGRMIRTDDGELLRWDDGSAMALEDHSMPFKLEFDEKGLVKSKEEGGMKAVDPFYRHFWQLGSLEVDPAGILDEDKGFALGRAGVLANDNKSVPLYGKPTRYSGAAPQDIKGEAGQVTMGGLEVAMNDLSALLSETNELSHLTDAITGMVTGTAKERVLNAVMGRMLDESAQETHLLWKRGKDQELIDPESPFLGAAPEAVVLDKEASQLEGEALLAWIQEQAPEGAEVPAWKLKAFESAPEGTVLFDPAYKSYADMVESGDAVRQTGEAAVAPLALSLYLSDFRNAEDLQYTLDNILSGKDKEGKEELEKVNRVAYLASQLVLGERAYDNEVAVMEASGEVQNVQGRRDFASWHSLHSEDEELAELDAYTLAPAANWLMEKLDSTRTKNGRAVLEKVVSQLVESAAADAHNLGWKASKDRALADDSNPFIGWASVRNRVSCKTPEVAEMSASEIAEFYDLPAEQVTESKAEAIREATRQAVAEGKEKGTDITHTLYKPYQEMLADQKDGGIRGAGGNAVPLMTLALYLSDFRGGETDSVDGLKQVLAGLITGTDKTGLKDVTMLNHVAFQAAQLPYGERSFETEVPLLKNTGQTKVVKANKSMTSYASATPGTLEHRAKMVEAGARWMDRNLDELVEH